jgi:hypothetical protein
MLSVERSAFAEKEKTRIENFDPGLKILPRWCRLGESPVPFR